MTEILTDEQKIEYVRLFVEELKAFCIEQEIVRLQVDIFANEKKVEVNITENP